MVSPQSGDITQTYKQSEPLAKRRRIALACSACRVRKSRCDGRRPSCSTCKTFALECVYEPSESATNVLVRKEYVSDLEERLKSVERTLQRHDDLLTGHLSTCSTTIGTGSTGQSGDRLELNTARQGQDGIQLDAPNVEDTASDDAKTDGLAIAFVDEHTPAFYGESSNIVFTRCLLRAISVGSKVNQHGMGISCKDKGSTEDSSLPFSQAHSPSDTVSPKPVQLLPSTLPPGEDMDALLSAYFMTYGSMFPFLHEPTFRKAYNEYKASGFAKFRRPWLGLLNMIFALASNIDQSGKIPAKERFKTSYGFFVRAVSLCSQSSMRTVSLDIVQYLLLAVLYLQGTQRSIQTWSVHGILVRTAIALGLHSEQSGQGLDPIQQEVRRRTWLTIYCLDKLLSVAFGRPPSIPDEYIIVQLPSPWISSPETSTPQPKESDMKTDFLNVTVRLYQIIGRSVTTQYGMNLGLATQDVDDSTAIQTASAMRQELRRWSSSLPPHLDLCETGSDILLKNTDSNRLRVILTLRYHFASILIHRPLLCATLRYLTTKEAAAVGSALPYRMQLAMAEAHECIRSAEKTIEIVHTALCTKKRGYSNLGVWFFTLFYVFTSSLVILGRAVLDQHGIHTGDDATSSSACSYLTKAVEALDNLDKGNGLVNKSAKFIRHLSERQIGGARYAAQNPRNVQAESETSAYEQPLPSFDLPTLTGLVEGGLAIPQFSISDPFNPFEEFNLNFDQSDSYL